MKHQALIATLIITVVAAAPVLAGKKNGTQNCSLPTTLQELPEESLSSEEMADLTYLREEEKLARDVYISLHETWSQKAFRNISRAETEHMEAVLVLLQKYGLQDPVGENGVGVFTSADLQGLYTQLVEAGNSSYGDALAVGAMIEELDINDIEESFARTNNEDVLVLYQNLQKGSRNHLRAFAKLLDKNDIEYEPAYLTPEEFVEIAESRMEKGLLDADGELICGGGKGKGGGASDGCQGNGNCDGSGAGDGQNGNGDCDGSGQGSGGNGDGNNGNNGNNGDGNNGNGGNGDGNNGGSGGNGGGNGGGN